MKEPKKDAEMIDSVNKAIICVSKKIRKDCAGDLEYPELIEALAKLIDARAFLTPIQEGNDDRPTEEEMLEYGLNKIETASKNSRELMDEIYRKKITEQNQDY